MSKCPISWNVHVERSHNFFLTQEAYNKYSKPETYEEKIKSRYALFPPSESNIGSNPLSKRSKKKLAQVQPQERVITWDKEVGPSIHVPQVHTLSESEDEESLQTGNRSTEKSEITKSKCKGKKVKKANINASKTVNLGKDGELLENSVPRKKRTKSGPAKTNINVTPQKLTDDILGSGCSSDGDSDGTVVEDKIRSKEKKKESAMPDDEVSFDDVCLEDLESFGVQNTQKKSSSKLLKTRSVQKTDSTNVNFDHVSIEDLENFGVEHGKKKISEQIFKRPIKSVRKGREKKDEKDKEENYEVTFDDVSIGDLEEFGVGSSNTIPNTHKLKKSTEDVGHSSSLEKLDINMSDEKQLDENEEEMKKISDEPSNDHEESKTGIVVEKASTKKSLNEQFPWSTGDSRTKDTNLYQSDQIVETSPADKDLVLDTRQRERKTERNDLRKYHHRKSNLTSREQSRYLYLHTNYVVHKPRKIQDKEKNEMMEFKVLHDRVSEEQQEFQQYLEKLAQTMKSEYNYIAPEAHRYYKERLAVKKKRVQSYPKYFNPFDKLNLSTLGPPCQLLFVKALLEMGTVPKLVIPNMDVGERPKIPLDYKSITKHCPCSSTKSTETWNHEPCSQDRNCDILSRQNKVHITISSSAMRCLVNNHAPHYNREWEIPFTVKDYELHEGEKKFLHRVVYIDNPLPGKDFTGRDKNTTFYKYALRANMARVNQTGHTFTLQHRTDSDQHHQEASVLPRQHGQEPCMDLLSPVKSPATKSQVEEKQARLRKEECQNGDLIGDPKVNAYSFTTALIDNEKIQFNKQDSVIPIDTVKNINSKVNTGDNLPGSIQIPEDSSNKFGTAMSAGQTFEKLANIGVGGKAAQTDQRGLKMIEKNKSSTQPTGSSETIVESEQNMYLETPPETSKQNRIEVKSIKPDDMCSQKENVSEGKDNLDKDQSDQQEKRNTHVHGTDISTVAEVSLEHISAVKCGTETQTPTNTPMYEIHVSSASDEESDALVIDEPEENLVVSMETERKGHQEVISMETPASPGSIESPSSPVTMETPASPTSEDQFKIPQSLHSEKVGTSGALLEVVSEISSPGKGDGLTPLSPDRFSSPDVRNCKIIPLQRDSEEENVIDNSKILLKENSPVPTIKPVCEVGLRRKRKTRSSSASLLEGKKLTRLENEVCDGPSDSKTVKLYKESTSSQQTKPVGRNISGTTSLSLRTRSGSRCDLDLHNQKPSDGMDLCLGQECSLFCLKDSSNEKESKTYVSNSENIDKDEKSANIDTIDSGNHMTNKNKSSSSSLEEKSENTNIKCSLSINTDQPPDSGESSDEIVSPHSKLTRSKKTENDKSLLSPRRRAQVIDSDSDSEDGNFEKSNNVKRHHSQSSSVEKEEHELTADEIEGGRKRLCSGKDLETNKSSEHESITSVLACTRRRGRSSVGAKKKSSVNVTQSVKQDQLETSSDLISDDIPIETVPMAPKRQTRRSVDSQCKDLLPDKLAILERVKRGLKNKPTSVEQDTEIQKSEDQPKRKRGRPSKKSISSDSVVSTEADNLIGTSSEVSDIKCDKSGTGEDKESNLCEDQTTSQKNLASKAEGHTKKTKQATTATVKGQQSSGFTLENIMQAQTKLLDNPKQHRDSAQQQYFSQFKFPEKHNITYHLWSLGAYNVMIRSGYHGVYKDQTQKMSFLHVSSKMEYQVAHGVEQITQEEISQDWGSAYVRPNCRIIRVRVDPLMSNIVSVKEEDLSKMSPAAYGFNPASGIQMLANVFHRLHQCTPGQYLLHHTPGSSECQIKKATDNNKRGSYDLHMTHIGYMPEEKHIIHIPWVPIDTSFIQQRFHKKGRIPATFEPRDYKGGKMKKKKRKH